MKTVRHFGALAGAFLLFGPLAANAQIAYVNLGSPSQKIDGFGCSSAWSGTMSPAQAKSLFGTGQGQLGLTILRVRIDPTGNNSAEKTNAAIAHSHGAKVLASPWTPPVGMKSNDNTVGGMLKLNEYGAYAQFLARSSKTLGADWVSIQNEPDAHVHYESCDWTGTQIDLFCRKYAPAIGKPVVIPESQNFDFSLSDPTLNDPAACSHVAIIGGHVYGPGPRVYANAIKHGKRVWMTEHYINGQDIGACMQIAKDINDCMDNQMSAYIWWFGFAPTSMSGCNILHGSSVLLNGDVLGQYARFIRPGYVRVNATYNPAGTVYVSAYKGAGRVVIVAINTGKLTTRTTFQIQNGHVSRLFPVQTDPFEKMAALPAVKAVKNAFTVSLPLQSVTTFVGD